jgi:hypothetical protein
MLGEGRVLDALADLEALGWIAFKLGDGFVNVGGHGGKGGMTNDENQSGKQAWKQKRRPGMTGTP